MTTGWRWRIAVAALAASLVPAAAVAQTQLTDFNGRWSGSGTDRKFASDAPVGVRCLTRVRADARAMTTVTNCRNRKGLNKEIRVSVTVKGDAFSGTLKQNESDGDSFDGNVTGYRTGNGAVMTVRKGPLPVRKVTLQLHQASYSMRVTNLELLRFGTVMMDVTFRRAAAR